MSRNILVLDPGSSSLKFGLFSFKSTAGKSSPDLSLSASGIVERLGSQDASFAIEGPRRGPASESIGLVTIQECVTFVLEKLKEFIPVDSKPPAAVGCRVVHGGKLYVSPTLVTAEVLESIRSLTPLAPLHNPVAADLIESCSTHLPNVPVYAVFDTAFHHTMPEVARTYALPFDLCEQHDLRRFGFHGIAHQYVSSRLLEEISMVGMESRWITCHLGNGASICAVRNGLSIDTSMGMTPMEGLVMGTRCGDVDPGLLLYLMQTPGVSPEKLGEILNQKSGLLGVSGTSSDMRDLEHSAENGDTRAELALELFAYRAAKTIGAYTVVLEGLDALSFSGGIGEHSAEMRRRICRRLEWLGVRLDPDLNGEVKPGKSSRISDPGSRIQVWVIPADENMQIARDVMRELTFLAGP